MTATPLKMLLLPEYRYQKDWKEEGSVLLTISENRPRLKGENPALRKIDRYFDTLAQRWRTRWERHILPEARAAWPVRPWTCSLDCHLTLLNEDYLSLWWEAREDTDPAHPRRIREGEVWRLADGMPLTLAQLIQGKRWRQTVLDQVSAQIRAQLDTGISLYYEDWPRLCRKHLSPHRCYLTETGPVVFFPFCSIAPALENFPTFPLSAEV